MKKLLPILTLCFLTFACYGQKSLVQDAKTFKKTIEETKDIQLVDVRTKKEFDQGRIPNAVMVDFYQKDFREQMNKLDKNKPIAVYCTIGGRSGTTGKMLVQMGFKNVYDLDGGIIGWQKAGYKLVKD